MNYLSCSAFIVDVTLVCVSCIFLLFCTLHLSPAITFGPDFTFNDSINDFLPCASSSHFISFTNRNNKSAFAT